MFLDKGQEGDVGESRKSRPINLDHTESPSVWFYFFI